MEVQPYPVLNMPPELRDSPAESRLWVGPNPSVAILRSKEVARPARYMHYFGYGIEYVNGTTIVDLAASALNTVFTVNVDAESGFQAYKLVGAAIETTNNLPDYRFKIQIKDGTTGFEFFSEPMPATCILGTGNLPWIFRRPIYVRPGTQLKFLLSDDGTALAHRIRLALHGIAIYPEHEPIAPERRYRGEAPFAYLFNFSGDANADAAAPAANGTAIASKTVDGDSDFEVYALTIESVGAFLIDIRRTGTRRAFFDRALHAANLGATTSSAAIRSAMAPFLLPRHAEMFLPAMSALSVVVTDLTGAADNNIRVGVHGRKLLIG